MTHDDRIEQLLNEHIAAREAGLLQPGPTAKERARVAAAQTTVSPPAGARALHRLGWMLALAACLLVALGLWSSMSLHVDGDAQVATLFDGRVRVLPVNSEARFAVTDAAKGRIRLDQGEVYVELPPEQNLKVEVDTPAGTATALGTRFYAHYGPSTAATTMLAVAVLGGLVEVANSHGSVVGRAGEVVVAEPDTAPEQQAELAPPPLLREDDWRSFGRTLGLLHYPEVQTELKLTDAQKERLIDHGPAERARAHRFFKELQALPHEERAKKAEEFRDERLAMLRDVLTGRQQWRFWQITLQQEGYLSLQRNEVADALDLDSEQRAGVAVIAEQYHDVRRQLVREHHERGADRSEWNARREQLAQQTNEALSDLLTDSQKQLWNKMVGAPFTLTRREG